MLALRVASALVVGPAVLVAAWLGGVPLGLLCLLISAGGIEEMAGMLPPRGSTIWKPLAHVLGLSFLAAAYTGDAGLWRVLPGISVIVSLGAAVVGHRGLRVPDAAATLCTVLYVPHLTAYILLLRGTAGGEWLLLFAIAVTWATDTVAYFVGIRLGRHRLCPALSPRKSWEGAIAGALAAGVLAAVIGRWAGFTTAGGAAVGVIASVAAQVGDLVESAIKRYSGVKDSGSVIPGHGGILDRFDSLLFAVPAVYFLCLLGRF